MKPRILFLFTLLLSFSIGCRNSKSSATVEEKENDREDSSSYSLKDIPPELKEISGISFIDNENLVAIQDEKGILYFYNITREAITGQRMFAGPGDFEDVVVAGTDAYALNSSGKIFSIKNFQSEQFEVDSFETELNEKNNTEGLAYDKDNNRLLIASKDEGIDNDKDKEIYSFDLGTKKLERKPVLSIKLEQIEEYFKGDALVESSKKLLKAFGNNNLNKVFRPSAITINPATKDLVVLSSLNNMVATFEQSGKLKNIEILEGKEFIQPEGIAFNPSGELYVANEGRGKKGNIIKVTYEK